MISKEEAKRKCLLGWNIRCNYCGSYGAGWVKGKRPGFGSLAFCPEHMKQFMNEQQRHQVELRRLKTIYFEQDDTNASNT